MLPVVPPPAPQSVFVRAQTRSMGGIAVASPPCVLALPLPAHRSVGIASPRVQPKRAPAVTVEIRDSEWPHALPGWPFHLDGPVAVLSGCTAAREPVVALHAAFAAANVDADFSAAKWKAHCYGPSCEFVAQMYTRTKDILVEFQHRSGSVSKKTCDHVDAPRATRPPSPLAAL